MHETATADGEDRGALLVVERAVELDGDADVSGGEITVTIGGRTAQYLNATP